ncbi:cytochrome c4 [Pseudidiomarina tainanensis]|jgi:cytochrome c553|uniref:Cytochrome c553 n=2 Tax=Pseudidiomarina TaxID=2800384 RepID=A0A1I6HLG7_9GAMM|nr:MULTISPECIES: c-type cytochrome [Pseudidiomarina]RZQ55879.1 cytochrome c4 [Pseudidiomarina tainanensis]SFR55244.1 Cytochrome c553 [Pseudidiomarina maritima]
MKKIAMFVGLYLGLTGIAMAATGDAEAGQQKSAVCAACHGPDGNAASDMYPKIAGQHESYLLKQLKDYKLAADTGGEQGRANAIMQGQVMMLSEQDMADLAAYFASQEMEGGAAPEDVIAAGKKLFAAGDESRGIAACAACHGPRGDGMALANFPNISGQHAAYTKQQLELFRSGERANDMNNMMRDVASKLTDKDIEILSQYIQGLY